MILNIQLNNFQFSANLLEFFSRRLETEIITRKIQMELYIANTKNVATYGNFREKTAEHFKNFNCKPEWRAFIGFCLMWTTTISYSRIMRKRLESVQTFLSKNVTLRLPKSAKNYYNYTYNSLQTDSGILFSFSISESVGRTQLLIDCFRDSVYDCGLLNMSKNKCSTFLNAYEITFDKSEEPYLLIMKENEESNNSIKLLGKIKLMEIQNKTLDFIMNNMVETTINNFDFNMDQHLYKWQRLNLKLALYNKYPELMNLQKTDRDKHIQENMEILAKLAMERFSE